MGIRYFRVYTVADSSRGDVVYDDGKVIPFVGQKRLNNDLLEFLRNEDIAIESGFEKELEMVVYRYQKRGDRI